MSCLQNALKSLKKEVILSWKSLENHSHISVRTLYYYYCCCDTRSTVLTQLYKLFLHLHVGTKSKPKTVPMINAWPVTISERDGVKIYSLEVTSPANLLCC